jgi:hypothetical protein
MKDEVKEVKDWVGYDAERNEGVRARFASNPNQDQDDKLIAT